MIREKIARIIYLSEKIAWGTRRVGVLRTTQGLGRLARLEAIRPEITSLQTVKSRLTVSFNFPSQLIPTLVVFGDLLEPELDLLPHTLGPESVAIDVGASIGTWTMMAARTGALVHACEPDPDNLVTLERNLTTNKLAQRVVRHQLAFGKRCGWATLQAKSRRYLNQVTEIEGSSPHKLELVTLTHFVSELGLEEVDVLKVNTAGHEAEVFSGAFDLFLHGRVRLALFLDGLAIRDELRKTPLPNYHLGVYNGDQGSIEPVQTVDDLDLARTSPMNHYLILIRREAPGNGTSLSSDVAS